jgi:broad specificity phosphatase PhoE
MDVPLDEVGRQQAGLIARRFSGKPLSRIYSSPLLRAAETAQAIAKACGLEVTLDDRLREYHMGDWTGLTGDEIMAVTPEFHHDGPEITIPKGETASDMRQRIESFLKDILAHHTESDTLVIVSHGGTLGAIVGAMLGTPVQRRHPFAFGNTSITKVVREHNRWRLRSLNDRCHLRTEVVSTLPEGAKV